MALIEVLRDNGCATLIFIEVNIMFTAQLLTLLALSFQMAELILEIALSRSHMGGRECQKQ